MKISKTKQHLAHTFNFDAFVLNKMNSIPVESCSSDSHLACLMVAHQWTRDYDCQVGSAVAEAASGVLLTGSAKAPARTASYDLIDSQGVKVSVKSTGTFWTRKGKFDPGYIELKPASLGKFDQLDYWLVQPGSAVLVGHAGGNKISDLLAEAVKKSPKKKSHRIPLTHVFDRNQMKQAQALHDQLRGKTYQDLADSPLLSACHSIRPVG